MVNETDKIIPKPPDKKEEVRNTSWAEAIPVKQGLYDPELEKDACGVGFAW
jgi:glutamate synthase (NADH)